MNLFSRLQGISLVSLIAAAGVAGEAHANTINQNTSWTVQRSSTLPTYRVVAYGDSIFAGYQGGLYSVARRASPYVEGEYLSQKWNANIQVVRRTKSGARADDIYNNKIVAERSHMQATNTRVVMFEMCGNDYLQARSALSDQTGTCSLTGLDSALATCTTYMERAMQYINANAAAGVKAKVIMNLYYPGYAADNSLTNCTNSAGQRLNKQNLFLPYLARSNWRACNLAARYGFQCADAFAEMMGASYDSNGDGVVDGQALRYRAGETEADYVNRISTTLRSTIRDSNAHLVNATTSYDYMLSDDVHPTYAGGTVSWSIFSSGTSGSSPPDYTATNGRNPVWNQFGHERSGWEISRFDPAAP